MHNIANLKEDFGGKTGKYHYQKNLISVIFRKCHDKKLVHFESIAIF